MIFGRPTVGRPLTLLQLLIITTIVLVVVAVVLALLDPVIKPSPEGPGGAPGAKTKNELPKDLDKWYEAYNSEYFGDKLPKDTVIDWGEPDPNRMGSTSVLPDGRFHIAFNEKYCLADRTVHMVLMHEDCHIATFSEVTHDPKTEHGPRWRTCMLNLYQQGAFKKDLIDGIE